MKSNTVANAGTGMLVICAVIMTILAVSQRLDRHPADPAQAEAIADWRPYATAGQRIGPADARVTIVEFSDFQCPYCRAFHKTAEVVQRKHPSEVAIVFRHSPLEPIHPYARAAAIASECAAENGRFEAFADRMFGDQASIPAQQWSAVALAAGVRDTVSFKQCLAGSAAVRRLDEDAAAARRLGVSGTPTVLVNGLKYPGAIPVTTLDSAVSALLKKRSEG